MPEATGIPLDFFDDHIFLVLPACSLHSIGEHSESCQKENCFVLLDTGSPVTLSRTGVLNIAGLSLTNLSSSFFGAALNTLNELCGKNFDALLGGDALSKLPPFSVTREEKVLRFGAPQSPKDIQIEFSTVANVPRCKFTAMQGAIDGSAFLDTGAKVSYIHSRFMPLLNNNDVKKLTSWNTDKHRLWAQQLISPHLGSKLGKQP